MRLVDGFGAAGKSIAQSAGRAVSMPEHAKFDGCRDLVAYWEALRGDKIVPARCDFSPRGIEKSLASTFVAERVASSVVRIRVAGTHLNDLLGMDVRGMPVTSFFDPEARGLLSDACRRVFDGPEKVELELQSPGRLGRSTLFAKLVLMPMSDNNGQITRMVGCLEASEKVIQLPRRFGILKMDSTALSGAAPDGNQSETSGIYAHPDTTTRPMELADGAKPEFVSRRIGTAKSQNEPTGAGQMASALRLVVDNT